MTSSLPLIGCAGWSLPREQWPWFPSEGSHLQRYAGRLRCVEINSSFYRPHRPATYARWADSVPGGFRFSVKVPKLITHTQRLIDCTEALDEFLAQCTVLGERLGCLLVQLPPSLRYEPVLAQRFFSLLRERFEGQVVLEPRHASWTAAGPLLEEQRIAQAVVDPSRISTDRAPAGWPGLAYWRLHGSPQIYHDAYGPARIAQIVRSLRAAHEQAQAVWCIFDNTASGAAVADALLTQHAIGG